MVEITMRRSILGPIGASAALVAVLGMPAHHEGDAARIQTTTSSLFGVRVDEVVLQNDFRLLVVQDHRVPRVAASLWYRFGGLAERNGEHGAAHFLEHAVHQGTTTVGVTNVEEDRAIQRQIMDTEPSELVRQEFSVWLKSSGRQAGSRVG